MNKEVLRALRARVEQAAGPDRDIDGDLAAALNETPPGAFRIMGVGDGGTFGIGAYNYWNASAYTGSIDAALASVERLLPGQSREILEYALLNLGTAYTLEALPRSIISAMLSALEAQAE